MTNERKEKLLEAMEITKDEYVNGTHELNPAVCKLCSIVDEECNKCIMNIFSTSLRPYFGCIYRFNRAEVSWCLLQDDEYSIVKFFENSIELIKNTDAEKIGNVFNFETNTEFAQKLKELDVIYTND